MASILIVDDRPINREFLVTLLGYQGHRLIEATDGLEGLKQARAEQPDLIITDVLMPQMDGYEFVRQLRDEPALAETPIIFYTAYYQEAEAQALAQACGVPYLLPKPSKPEVILKMVETALGSPLTPVSPPPPEMFDREHLRLLTNKLSEKVDELQGVNTRLSALIDINLQLASERDPHRLLESFCHAARELVGARVATVSVLREGKRSLRHFFASGLEVKSFTRLDSLLPRLDVLAPLLAERRAYRLQNPGGDPESIGFPPAYPPIHSLLAAPLLSPSRVYGWLCLIDKAGGEVFSQEDEHLVGILAAQVGRVYENGRLYVELQRHTEDLEREVAERKQAEKALEEERALLAQRVAERTAELSTANAELARAARIKDEFLAGMSHELRTPLNAVLGLSEVLLEQISGPLNEHQLKHVRIIEESGRHLLALINDILDLSKIEAGKLELQLEPVSVEAVCQASLQFVKEAALKKRIDVSFTMDPFQASMGADVRRLKQILVNLLSNAVKFTPEGGHIGLVVMGEAESKVIHFTVWDTGIGIAPEDVPRLFKRFVQVDSSLSRRHEGTGLGLALVARLVDLHGGTVAVKSDGVPDQGSQFTVSLPWFNVPATTQKAKPAKGGQDFSPFRQVLIVEDLPLTAEQISRYLQEWNIEVFSHPRGEGTVEKVIEQQPDLILLDLLLPDLSGWDVLAQLKAHPRTQDIPVIIVSIMDERSSGLGLGAAEYLVKPISRRQLYEVLSKIAQGKIDTPIKS